MPKNRRVLISGASIAGPALAFWLQRYGFDVTLVEKAATPRLGGQAVDFKGNTHRTVLTRMGIWDLVQEARLPPGDDAVIVDASGRHLGTMPAEFGAGDVEIRRSDLVRILHRLSAKHCRYLFDDEIVGLEDKGTEVEVTLKHAKAQTYDLVVAADGIHSRVRKLAMGPEENFVKYLGYHYALADLGPSVHADDNMYNEPGRMVMTSSQPGPTVFVFRTEPPRFARDDVAAQKKFLQDAFLGARWQLPRLLERVPQSTDFYLDAICRAKVPNYAKGRVALVGDAAYGNTLGGFGTGLAIVGAYVLAGELVVANGDYRAAFAQYEQKFRSYARVAEGVNAGKILAPRTRLGISLRNRLFSIAPLFGGIMKLMEYFATDIALPDYESSTPACLP